MSPLRACFAIVLSFALFSPGHAADPAGRVLLAVGDTTALRGGTVVRLERGAVVAAGDQLRTGRDSHLQVRMSDEGILALRGESALSIDAYRFRQRSEGDESAVFRLLKGGFRTITGLIGRVNRDAYRVETGVATIGIRGTAFALALCEGGSCRDGDGAAARDGLYGAVTEGQIEARNRVGGALFSAGEAFFSAAPDAGFQRLLAPPPFLNARIDPSWRRAGDAVTPPGARVDRDREPGRIANAGGRLAARDIRDRPAGGDADPPRRGAILAGSALLPVLRSEVLTDSGASTVLPRPDGFVMAMPLPSGGYLSFFGDGDRGRYNAFNQLTAWSGPGGTGGDLGAGDVIVRGGIARGEQVLTWGRWNGGEVTGGGGVTVRGIPVLFVTANAVATNSFAANLPTDGTVTYAGVGGPGVSAVRAGYFPNAIAGRIEHESLTLTFGSTPAANLDMTIRLSSAGGITSTPAFDHTYQFSATVGPSANRGGGDFSGGFTGSCVAGCSGGITGRVAIGLTGPDGYRLAVTSGGFADPGSDLSASFIRVYEASGATGVVTRVAE